MRLDERSWQPRFGTHSVGVAYVEDQRITGAHDACSAACPMWRADQPHGHFRVQIGYGFLGVLERFAGTDDGAGERTYDFSTRPGGEAGEELRAEERAGRLVTVSLPAKLFGPAAWSGLSPAHRRIVDALMAEATRPRKGRDSDRPDHAAVLVGAVVPGSRTRTRTTCPHLRPDGRYVAFGGNGRRSGAGYRIVGAENKGWLFKCGYAPESRAKQWPRVARAYLDDLGVAAGRLGLIVVGLDPRDGSWFDLKQMTALAATGTGWRRLDSVHLRVYAPENYLDRLRGHFASTGRFASIPGSVPEGHARCGDLDIATRMDLIGMTQRRLAEALEVSQPFVSKLLTGVRPWPSGLTELAEAFVAAAERRGPVDANA